VPGLNVFELRARSLRPEPRVAAAASTSGNSSISSTWVAWIIGPFCQSIHPRTGIFDSLLRLVDHRPGMVAMRGDGCRRRLGVDEPDDRAVGEGKRLAILDLLCAFCGSESSQAKADVEGRAKERQVAARRDPRVTCRRCNIGSPLNSIVFLFCSAACWSQDGFVGSRFLHKANTSTAAFHACLRAQRTADTPIHPLVAIAGARPETP
jgi:hypothetical protein